MLAVEATSNKVRRPNNGNFISGQPYASKPPYPLNFPKTLSLSYQFGGRNMQRFLNFILRRPRRLRWRGNFEPPGFRFLELSRPTLIRRAETRNVSDFPLAVHPDVSPQWDDLPRTGRALFEVCGRPRGLICGISGSSAIAVKSEVRALPRPVRCCAPVRCQC